jgi:hypothetical protein
METQRRRRSSWVAAAIAVAALAACSGAKGDNHQEEGFEERLASIVEATSSRYGELGERAGGLNPNAPLADDFKAQMRAVAVGDRRAADEIEALTPPEAAAELVQQLETALRARAGSLEQAAGPTTITLQRLEEEGSITEAGEQINRVLQQIRDAGFFPEEQPHDEQ